MSAGDEKRLLSLFSETGEAGRIALLEYAEFLADKYPVERSVASPEPIPRPDNESVIGAMKRLKRTYSMLNTDDLFHRASGLMSEHMMQGRQAADVIDDLEALFEQHYQAYLTERQDG